MSLPAVIWGEAAGHDVVVVLQADGKTQAFTSRAVEEAQSRIAGVLISEFGFSAEDADEVAETAAEQRHEAERVALETEAKLAHAEGMASYQAEQNAALQRIIDQQASKVAEAEKQTGEMKAVRDRALADLRAAQGALETAVAERERLNAELAAAKAPPADPPKESKDAPEAETAQQP